MIDPLRRRTFLGILGAAGPAIALPAFAKDSSTAQLVLIDTRLTEAELAGVSGWQKAETMALDHADVLNWRRELSSHLAEGGMLTAYTRWDLALLLSDLGREAGCAPLCEIDGNGIMITRFRT